MPVSRSAPLPCRSVARSTSRRCSNSPKCRAPHRQNSNSVGMPDGKETITVKVIPGIGAIDAAAWDACAGEENPFLSHAFLKALEDSGSCRAATGWQPQHLVLEAPDGRAIGTVPLYLKNHSYGEYVFDHAWANAYERAGGSYYPKLQAAVPFTPVTGPRLLLHPNAPEGSAQALITAMEQL